VKRARPTLHIDADNPRTPATGEPWRAVIVEAEVDEHLAHRLASAARFPAWDNGQTPPVDFEPNGPGAGWTFTAGARQLDPVQVVDVVDAWLAAFDEGLGPEWSGARAWAWQMAGRDRITR
jgi:hypothetical protein